MDQYAGSPGHSICSCAELTASFIPPLLLAIFWILWCKKEADAQKIRLDATLSGLSVATLPSSSIFTPNALSVAGTK